MRIKQIAAISLVVALAGCGGSGSSSGGGADQVANGCISFNGLNPERTAVKVVNSCNRSVRLALKLSPANVIQVEASSIASYPIPGTAGITLEFGACFAPFSPVISNVAGDNTFTCA